MLILILLIMLANPRLCLSGAITGIDLWFKTIFPTLIPFLIISNILVNVYSKRFKNPELCIIIIGLSCGCPMAAVCAAGLYKNSVISSDSAGLLTGICSSLSPAFMISYVFLNILGFKKLPFTFIIAYYIPLFLMLLIYFIFFKSNKNISDTKNTNQKSCAVNTINDTKHTLTLVDDAINSAFLTIAKLGGYIIIFNIVATFADRYLPADDYIRAVITGMLEITTGMNKIGLLGADLKLKIFTAGVLCSFGGVCCMLQSASILNNAGIGTKKYICCKIIISVLSLITYYLAVYV